MIQPKTTKPIPQGPERRETNPLVMNIKSVHQLIEVCRKLGADVVRGHTLVKIGMISGTNKSYRERMRSEEPHIVVAKSGIVKEVSVDDEGKNFLVKVDGDEPYEFSFPSDSTIKVAVGMELEAGAVLNPTPQPRLWRSMILPPKRKLTIPVSPDLVRIHKMISPLFKEMAVSDCSWAYVSGRGAVNASWHVAKSEPTINFIWREDIRDFFPSITTAMIVRFLQEKMGWAHGVAKIVASVSTYRGRLVQGSILSPDISNVMTADMHDELNKLASSNGIRFISYSDDLYFYGTKTKEEDDELWAKIKYSIKDILKTHGFILNYEKCSRRRQGLQILSMFIRHGYVVPDGKTESLYRAILLAALDPKKKPTIDGKTASVQQVLGKASWLWSINRVWFMNKFGSYIRKLKAWYPDTWQKLEPYFPNDFREAFFSGGNGKEAKILDEMAIHQIVGGPVGSAGSILDGQAGASNEKQQNKGT